VYRGQLGIEPDAVVVETKDISEPTYAFYSSTSDQFLYVTYWPDDTTGGSDQSHTFAWWCTTVAPGGTTPPFPTPDACNAAYGFTHKLIFSSTPDPVPGFTASNPGAEDTWLAMSLEPKTAAPIFVSTAPVGTLARVAWLTDAVPTNSGVAITESVDSTHGNALFEWHGGTAVATTAGYDPATNSIVTSATYVPSARINAATGLPFYVSPGIANDLSAGPSRPSLTLISSDIRF
jgi:hypothetical protein